MARWSAQASADMQALTKDETAQRLSDLHVAINNWADGVGAQLQRQEFRHTKFPVIAEAQNREVMHVERD